MKGRKSRVILINLFIKFIGESLTDDREFMWKKVLEKMLNVGLISDMCIK